MVSNAVKFTPKGGRIAVKLNREVSELKIAVSDSGRGISSELMPFIFDRFWQADSSTRRKFGGLGLSIVKHMVEAHGGTVEAYSEGEGLGSTFTLRLPIKAVKPADGLEAHNGSSKVRRGKDDRCVDDQDISTRNAATFLPLVRLDGIRLLVVDDEPDARRIRIKMLAQAGAIVTAAGSAADALELLSKMRPDVLVSDIGMPDEDGYALIRQVRSRGYHAKDLPAVALTAFVQKEDERMAILAGFQVHVPKPVNSHNLTALIASLAGRTSAT